LQNMNLSMTPYTQAGNFVCSQYDVGRTLTITLQDENGDYEIPTGATVKIQATKPSGLGFSKTCTWSGSTVTIVSTADMTDESGRFPVELQVTSGNTILASTNFFMKVEKSPHPTGTTDGTAEEVISEITVLVERAEAAAETAAEDAAAAAQETIDEILDYLPQEVSDLKGDIGDLSDLETEDKSSLVNAINEARGSGGSGGGLTNTEKSLILELFGKAAYAESDADTAYEALCNLWDESFHSVTWNGSGYTKGNSSQTVEDGATFTSTITANSGKTIDTVTVTMGGTTVQGAWSEGTVTIPSVTGNVVITVTTSQVTVSSISAVYTQSGTIYETDELDMLKDDLVVTATFMDSTTGVISSDDYTLSGALAEGTSTITVLFGGKTATFNVTVTHATVLYTITNNLTDCTNSNDATRINEQTAYSGTLTPITDYIIASVSITMSGTDITSTAYDSETGAISIASVTGNVVITAEAVEDVGWISGQAYAYNKNTGYALNTSGLYSRSDYTSTDLLPISGASYVTINPSENGVSAYFYDATQTVISDNSSKSFAADNTIKYPVSYLATKFAVTTLTKNFPTSIEMIPIKCPEISENTAWIPNKEYEMRYPDAVIDGTYSSGNYYTTDYFNCVAASNINFGALYKSDSNATVYFYDANKTQMTTASLGYVNIGETKDITVPTGAYYFKVTAKFRRYSKTIIKLS